MRIQRDKKDFPLVLLIMLQESHKTFPLSGFCIRTAINSSCFLKRESIKGKFWTSLGEKKTKKIHTKKSTRNNFKCYTEDSSTFLSSLFTVFETGDRKIVYSFHIKVCLTGNAIHLRLNEEENETTNAAQGRIIIKLYTFTNDFP